MTGSMAESSNAEDAAARTILIQFAKGQNDWQEKPNKMRDSVSAIVPWDECLWVASDQTATVERLVADNPQGPTEYGDHRSFRLIDFVPLPERGVGNPDQEVDLEGIDIQRFGPDGPAGYLWLVGSHSHARKKVDEDASSAVGIGALASVSLDRNRCALIRIPVIRHPGELPELVSTCPDPRDPTSALTAGLLSDLLPAIAADEHLRLFFVQQGDGAIKGVPGKDNGLDIEGLAVSGDKIFLGLRGPVLRGWSVILQLEIEPSPGAGELRLRNTADSPVFRKYFVQLGGLGVRDLLVDGEDLLILAGPTMDLDNPVRIHRWTGGATGTGEELVRAERLPVVRTLRTADNIEMGRDHPEGFTRLATADGPRLLVAHDSPADSRIQTKGAVRIDSLRWP